VNVELKGAVYGNREDVGIEVQVGSLQKREVNVDVGVTGATNVQLLACREEIKPYRPFIKRLSWNTGNIPDGDYAITVIVNDQHGRELAKGKKKLTIAGRSRERWTGEMKGLNSEWERVKERLLRKDREHYEKIKPVLTRIAIQIADMKQAIQRNELKDLPGLKQEIEKQLVEIK